MVGLCREQPNAKMFELADSKNCFWESSRLILQVSRYLLKEKSWLRVQPLGRKDWKICLDWIARGLEMIQPQALVVPLSD